MFLSRGGNMSKKTAQNKIDKQIKRLQSEGFVPVDTKPLKRVRSKINKGDHFYRLEAMPNKNIETVDVVFNENTGEIIDWGKTARTKSRGLLTLEISAHTSRSRHSLKRFKPGQIAKRIYSFTIKKSHDIKDKLAKIIAQEIDELINKRASKKGLLVRFDQQLKLPAMTKKQKKAMKGKPVLLMVHGIISSTKGAFSKLSHVHEKLSRRYQKNIIAYDHFTLSQTTKENAANLIKQLPEGCQLDILCHSRGAGVVRSLLELPDNQAKLNKKGITVKEVIFVAGACLGSPLATKEASDRFFKLFNGMFLLAGGKFNPFPQIISLLLKAIANGILSFPGVESMNPIGDIINDLNNNGKGTVAKHYNYIRANYDPRQLFLRIGDALFVDLPFFKEKANDIIVPWDGAGVNQTYLKKFEGKIKLCDMGTKKKPQHSVWHISFFEQEKIQKTLVKALST